MNKIYFMFLFFIKTELVDLNELFNIKENANSEIIKNNFKKCSDLYYYFLNKKLLFQDYKECLFSNLDDLENLHKYLIFNELFFQKFNKRLSKEDLKKYLLFVYDKNNFDNELKNFQILIEILSVYEKEKKELDKNNFSILLYLINFLDENIDCVINFYINRNNQKILKIKEILNNDKNFLSVFKIIMRWKCDLNSSWINRFSLEDLLIAENYFQKNNKILSYLKFEILQNKKNLSNFSINQLLSSESDLEQNYSSIEKNESKKEEKQKTKITKINMKRDVSQYEKNEKKFSIINVDTGNEKNEYIIESSKNDKLTIKIRNTSCEESKNEKNMITDEKENNKNCNKNQESAFKASFVIGILLILFL